MSQIVLDLIAADTAALTRMVAVPTGDLGYGLDLSCVTDLTETLEEVDPFSPLAIGQALYRRLSTPRGSLPDDGNYGLNVVGFINKGVTTDDIRDLQGQIKLECVKDDRVDSVEVVVTQPDRNSLGISIAVVPVDPSVGGFRLVLAVVDGQLLMEEFSV